MFKPISGTIIALIRKLGHIIDILFYNEEIINHKDLTVPHAYLHKRNFVLFPLEDVLPLYTHPLLQKTIQELKKECDDELEVLKCLA